LPLSENESPKITMFWNRRPLDNENGNAKEEIVVDKKHRIQTIPLVKIYMIVL